MSKAQTKKATPEHLVLNRLAIVLKEERTTNRMLAEMVGYDETTVSKWATNRVQPSVTTLYRIALLLNRNLQELLVSTNNISSTDRNKHLKMLAVLAKRAQSRSKKD